MTTSRHTSWIVLGIVLLTALPAGAQNKSYRLPATDLKQRIIWGSVCDGPDGTGLAFGGQDQEGDDGNPHTRIKVGDEWKPIVDELRKNNPLQPFHSAFWALRNKQKDLVARARRIYFEGNPDAEKAKEHRKDLQRHEEEIVGLWEKHKEEIEKAITDSEKQWDARRAETLRHLIVMTGVAGIATRFHLDIDLNVKCVHIMQEFQVCLERLSALCDAEPLPRALSPLVYDPKTKRFILFAGDHLDHLTNDTWAFDPATRKWSHCVPEKSPPPRASHTLKANGDGTITMSGGYTYTSSTEYCGAQYRDLDDGDWVYDVAADTWTGSKEGVPLWDRTYRTGPFHPDFYLEGPKPDAAEFAKLLKDLPANTWTPTNPPKLPRLNRDWGTAVLDTDRDLILRWSGGHSAHGGTDVLHYHIATNRWELSAPVEFPLGQLYTNTDYPEGFNFNGRPWITGHTYQNYGYEPGLKQMIFAGRTGHCYLYDPDQADWNGRFAKPKGMAYNSCFYTLTLCPTPHGLMCWTDQGKVFQFDSAKKEWVERPLTGAKLPGSVVDNSTMVHDSKRDRLLFVRKGYGDKVKFDGDLFALNLKTNEVTTLAPEGKDAASAVPYLCQLRYDAANDLLLVGGTLPASDDGTRRTPAFDCAANRWVSLKLTGTDPSGKSGRNVSLGLVYDAKRKLFWAVDTDSKVYVLRLDPKTADVQPLR